MLKTVNLRKIYTTAELETTSLNEVNLEVDEGDFVAIMGPSGCGKSTLLNVLGLLDEATDGQYLCFGEDVTRASESRRSAVRKGNIGFIFQSFNLIDELSIADNVELPLMYLRVPASERSARVQEALERVGIAHRAGHFPQQLSGGEQQRVAIARSVVTNPKLILADEPTGNLDSANGEAVMQLLLELNRAGTTIVMVTHSRRDAEYAHRIIHLFDGSITEEEIVQPLVPAMA